MSEKTSRGPRQRMSQTTAPQQISKRSKLQLAKIHQDLLKKHQSYFSYDSREKAFRMIQNHNSLSLGQVIPTHIRTLFLKPRGANKYFKLKRFPPNHQPAHQANEFQTPPGYSGKIWRGRAGVYRNYLFRFSTPKSQKFHELLSAEQSILVPKYAKYFQTKATGIEMKKNIDWLNLRKAIAPGVSQLKIKLPNGKIFNIKRFSPNGHFEAPADAPDWIKVKHGNKIRVGIYKGMTIITPPKDIVEIKVGKPTIEIIKTTPPHQPLWRQISSSKLKASKAPKMNGKPRLSKQHLAVAKRKIWEKFRPELEKLYQFTPIAVPKLKIDIKPLGKAIINRDVLTKSENSFRITNKFGRRIRDCSQYMRYFFGKVLNASAYKELVRRGGVFQNAWDIWAFTKFMERGKGQPRGSFSRLAGNINLASYYRNAGNTRIELSRSSAENSDFRQRMAKLFQASFKSYQRGEVAQVLYFFRGSPNQWRAINGQNRLKVFINKNRYRYLHRPQNDRLAVTHVEPLIGRKEVDFYKSAIENHSHQEDYLSALIKIYAREHFSTTDIQSAFNKFKILQESKTKLFLTDQKGEKREVIIKKNPQNRLLGYSLYYAAAPNQPIQFKPQDREYFSFNDLATRGFDNIDSHPNSPDTCSMLDNYLRYTGRGVPRRLPVATVYYPGVKWSIQKKLKGQSRIVNEAQQAIQNSSLKYVIINPTLKSRASLKAMKKQFNQFYQDILVAKYNYTAKDKNLYLNALKLVGVSFDHQEILKVPLPIFDLKILRSTIVRDAVYIRYFEEYKAKVYQEMAPNNHIIQITAGSNPWNLIKTNLLNKHPYFRYRQLTTKEQKFILHHIDRLNESIDLRITSDSKQKNFINWQTDQFIFIPKDLLTQLIKVISKRRQLAQKSVPNQVFAGLDKKGNWILSKVPNNIRVAINHAAPHDPEIRRLLLLTYAREQGRGTNRNNLKKVLSQFTSIRSLGVLQIRPAVFNVAVTLPNGKTIKLWQKLFPRIKSYQQFKQELKSEPSINIKAAAHILREHRSSVLAQVKLLTNDPYFAAKNPALITIGILSAYNSRPTAFAEANIEARFRHINTALNKKDSQRMFKPYQKDLSKFINKYAPKLSWIRRGATGSFVRALARKISGRRSLVSPDEKRLVTSNLRSALYFYLTAISLKDKYPQSFKGTTKKQIEQAAIAYLGNPLTPLLHSKIKERIKNFQLTPKNKQVLAKLKQQLLAGKIYQQIINLHTQKTGLDLSYVCLQYQHLFQKGIGKALNYGFAVVRGKNPDSPTQLSELEFALPTLDDFLDPIDSYILKNPQSI